MPKNKRPTGRDKRIVVWSILAALLLVMVSGAAAGPVLPQGAVERPRQVVAAGGTSATQDSITLRATVGQPVVGVSTNGGVRLGHGFWGAGAVEGYTVYLPVVLKNYP